MKKGKYFYLFALLPIFFEACFSPRPVIRMEPEGDHIKWNYGREVVYQNIGGIETRVAFEDFTKEDLIFNIEIINLSDTPVLVDPARFFLSNPDGQAKTPACDPEKKLLHLDLDASKSEANSKNLAVATGVVAAAAIATAIALGDDDDDDNDDGDVNVLNLAYFGGGPAHPLPYYPVEREFWTHFALRKTTLDSDYKIEGKIVFPRTDFYTTFLLNIPIGDRIFKNTFNQYLISPE